LQLSEDFSIRLLKERRKRMLKEFAETTSAHGCALVSKSSSASKRSFWIAAICLAWILCGYQIWVAIHKYFQYQTTVSVQIRHMTNITFPAVTICNLNPIRSSWLIKSDFSLTLLNELKKSTAMLNFTERQWKESMESNRFADHITPEMRVIYKHLRLIYEKNVNLSEAGHDLKDMLLDCTFQSTKCTANNFTRWEHGTYGNCYTMIVSDADDHYSSFVGPLYGLSVTLYVADKEYLARHSQGAGFKVEVHPPEYVPFPEDKGFTISPGVMTSVGIKQMRISRMPLPYDGTDCGDLHGKIDPHGSWKNASLYYKRYSRVLKYAGYPDPVNYTTQACVKSCYQRRLVDDCGCVDPSFVTREDIREFFPDENKRPSACDVVLESSLKCVRKSMGNTTTSGICELQCPQSCHEQGYVARITASLWPRASYYDRIKDSWKNQIPSMETMLEAREARTNLAKLEVYFEELNYESVVESPAQDVWMLLSTIGGTLGLYVGMSFLTLGEFTELILKCLAVSARRHLQKRASVDKL
ncbi:FMRFamide-activated amiloride-sensitive sodium channel, partial [Toxocara canis]